MEVITTNTRTEIVEGKSNHGIFWKGDGLSAPPIDHCYRSDDPAGTSNLPFSWNCGYTFSRVEVFTFPSPQKCLASSPSANRSAALLHFCNNLEVAPFFFRT
jgi:hypothetical protein